MREKLWNSNYIKIWMSNFLIHFSFTLIVPLLPLYLSGTFGAGKDAIGAVLAGYSVLALMVRPFFGFVVDSFPRKAVLLLCNFFFCALFAGYLVAGSLTLFALFRTLHGAPFGAVTIACNTVAIDVLPSSRRTEGMGYYGLSNNLATAIGPVLAVGLLESLGGNFKVLFAISMAISLLGLSLDASIKMPPRDFVPGKKVLSLDRFFLMKGLPEAVAMILFAACHAIVSTYVAIYGRERLGVSSGTGLFFTLFATGLIVSRLTGGRALRENRISRNAVMGLLVSLCGYAIFALVPNIAGYYLAALVIGLGNGHWFPAFLNMFINLAGHNQRGTANSSILTAWDGGTGLGVLIGGVMAEHLGYRAAFVMASALFASGVMFYFAIVRNHFEKNKLR